MVWYGEACGEGQDLAEVYVPTFFIFGVGRGRALVWVGQQWQQEKQSETKVLQVVHPTSWSACAESGY